MIAIPRNERFTTDFCCVATRSIHFEYSPDNSFSSSMRLSRPASFFCRAARSFVALTTASASLSFHASRAAGDNAAPSAFAPAFDLSTSSSFSSASCRAESVPIVFAVAAFARRSNICFLCSVHHSIARLTKPRGSTVGGGVAARAVSVALVEASCSLTIAWMRSCGSPPARIRSCFASSTSSWSSSCCVRNVELIFERIFLIAGGFCD